jgi:hypothetical protein
MTFGQLQIFAMYYQNKTLDLYQNEITHGPKYLNINLQRMSAMAIWILNFTSSYEQEVYSEGDINKGCIILWPLPFTLKKYL